MTDMEERNKKWEAAKNYDKKQQEKRESKRSDNPLEVRGFTGEERIGKHESSVTIGGFSVQPCNREVQKC